jgi:lipid II:glycine glycyltransferase (peptidoglycan interpeptide bridge formation enzyme)
LLREYNTLGGVAEIFLTYRNDKVVGAAFNLSYQGFYENGWFATQKETQRFYSSYVMHHAMIRHAIQNGNHTYSFGRSTMDGGVHQFKKQWGVEDVPLQWVQFPAHKVNLRKQSWLKPIWKLVPVPIRKIAGRQLAKWIY